MIKIIIAASRLPGMTRWDYSQHLQNVHAEKMLAAPADFLANLASYVQNHVVDAAYGARGETGIPPTEVDSISETYHPSPEAVSFLTAHPYYLSVIQPDEHLFANPATLQVMVTMEEREHVPMPRRGALKAMHFIATREGVARESFFTAWRATSQAIVADPSLSPALCGYVRSHALPVPQERSQDLFAGAPINFHSGATSIWFDRANDLSSIARYRALFDQNMVQVSDSLIDISRSMLLITRELEIHSNLAA